MADRLEVLDRNAVPERRSTGEILSDIGRDLQEMVRAELRLARRELVEKAQRAGKAGGLLGAAALCGLFAFACLVLTCVTALAYAMPLWLAALMMAVFLACIGGACYAGGRERLKKIDLVPERTVQAMKDNVAWTNRRTS